MTEHRGSEKGHLGGSRIAAAAAVAAAIAVVAGPAYAESGKTRPIASTRQVTVVHPHGFEPGSVITAGACKGWLNTKKIGGKWNAQALVHSTSTVCGMALQRSHNGGSYKQISNYYLVKNGGQTNTGWHYDDRGYKSRVCIKLIGKSWHCGKGI